MDKTERALKFSTLRNDFPMLKKTMHGRPLIYFDSAATAQKPQCVIDTIKDYYQNHCATVHRAVYELSSLCTTRFQQSRETARKFINAKSCSEIIFTRGTTESINLVASSFGKAFMNPGDEIILSEIEHHANIIPWQMLSEEREVILRVIPVNDAGELDLATYSKLLSEKTKIVAIAHVSNALGTIHPIKEIIAMAHSAGAKVLVDGAQGAPHMAIDVQDLDADFYAFSAHKTFGPTGVGILYGKEELLENMPPYQGGGDMIKTVAFEKTIYNDLPLKFEAGTPMIAEVLGLGTALEYLLKIGMPEITLWEHSLLNYATEKLIAIEGLKIIGTAKEKGAIISFVIDGVHPLDLGTLLDLQGVAMRTGTHCGQTVMRRFGVPGTTRASFALYNNQEEIDLFVKILQNIIKKLR